MLIWMAASAVLVTGGPVLWMLLDNVCTLSTSLGNGESVNQCYTRWIGALSGWAAAAGALAAAIWTVRSIRRQMALQALQHRRDALKAELEMYTGPANALVSVMKAGNFILLEANSMGDSPNPKRLETFTKTIKGPDGILLLEAYTSQVSPQHASDAQWIKIRAEGLACITLDDEETLKKEIWLYTAAAPRVLEKLEASDEAFRDFHQKTTATVLEIDNKIAEYERG
ncbi:hypothetical protein LAX5112_01250 [Roseibium alexandrii]|uniref:Uncharacterized protein n=1 Tax=Roseibium alexandrii TaxID=388408 RepID=A0A0M6ZWP0_9HYPH|nr:hypothetical protein LAX5112_01250 [Roseibium alexandrii]